VDLDSSSAASTNVSHGGKNILVNLLTSARHASVRLNPVINPHWQLNPEPALALF